ncbi:MAG: glycosyltransferase family 2 protein [Pseudomonadota bacterium]
MTSVAVIILTRDEARHIERALASIAAFATQVFVVDSGSTDETVGLAEAAGATVLHHPWSNYARQFQWGLQTAPITAEWVMRLDADEVVEADLAQEIRTRLANLPASVTGVNVRRKLVFMGRWIRHGGRYPVTLLRLWRRGAARIEPRWMDEHMLLTEGEAVTFRGGLVDHNLNDLAFFTAKHDDYATREAIDRLVARHHLLPGGSAVEPSGSRAAGKRWMKERVYNRLPIWIGPIGYFLYRYVVQMGFLDGRPGLIYHALQGGWYRFLVEAKVAEFDAVLAPLDGRAVKIAALERVTERRIADGE